MNKQRGFLILAVILTLGVIIAIFLPFLQYVLGGVILAYLLYPIHTRLRSYIAPRLSAILVILSAILTIILPVLFISSIIIRQSGQLSATFSQIEVDKAEQSINSITGINVDLHRLTNQALKGFAATIFGSPSEILNVLIKITLGITLIVFLLYYLLVSGQEFVEWLESIIPLPEEATSRLIQRINQTTWAVVFGHILVALIQAMIAGIGLAIVGIPNAIFWTFVMVVLAFLPVVGVVMVWGPAAAYLFILGDIGRGLFLLLYGVLVVGLVDNYLRSYVVDYHTEEPLNPGVILLSVLGGIYTIGFMGLFIGPIVVGFLKAILEVFRDDYDSL